jgi:hypothetical protein
MVPPCFRHEPALPAAPVTNLPSLSPGGVTIRVHGAPASLQTQSYALNYHSAAGEHVVMANPNLTQGTPVLWLPKACEGQLPPPPPAH